jgi:hypothetical protein
MRVVVIAITALALAAFTLTIPMPVTTSKAFASKMNGKGGSCSEGSNCMSDRYKAATKAKAKKSAN